jgi:hypothetical protein
MNEFVKDKYKNYNFVWRLKKYKTFVNKKSQEKNFEKEEKFLDGRKKKEGKKKRRKERKRKLRKRKKEKEN